MNIDSESKNPINTGEAMAFMNITTFVELINDIHDKNVKGTDLYFRLLKSIRLSNSDQNTVKAVRHVLRDFSVWLVTNIAFLSSEGKIEIANSKIHHKGKIQIDFDVFLKKAVTKGGVQQWFWDSLNIIYLSLRNAGYVSYDSKVIVARNESDESDDDRFTTVISNIAKKFVQHFDIDKNVLTEMKNSPHDIHKNFSTVMNIIKKGNISAALNDFKQIIIREDLRVADIILIAERRLRSKGINLSEYMNTMETSVEKHKGMITKFMKLINDKDTREGLMTAVKGLIENGNNDNDDNDDDVNINAAAANFDDF